MLLMSAKGTDCIATNKAVLFNNLKLDQHTPDSVDLPYRYNGEYLTSVVLETLGKKWRFLASSTSDEKLPDEGFRVFLHQIALERRNFTAFLSYYNQLSVSGSVSYGWKASIAVELPHDRIKDLSALDSKTSKLAGSVLNNPEACPVFDPSIKRLKNGNYVAKFATKFSRATASESAVLLAGLANVLDANLVTKCTPDDLEGLRYHKQFWS